jgi:histidyl-tRNA synthetase
MEKSKLQPVKGTQDFFGINSQKFLHVVDTAKAIANNFAYSDLLLPIMEHTEIFQRSLGESSDIANKEMYTFDDRKSRSLTLRPEFTASVVRSIISSGLQKTLPLKLFSHGPLFRYERPQKGRYRQFHQVNFEYIGNADPMADAEIISTASHFLNKLGIKGLTLEINSLGDPESRKEYTRALVKYFSKYEDDLSEDSKLRLKKNPLRILDSKDEGDKKLVKGAPIISEFWNKESKTFFDKVLSYLDSIGIQYKQNDSLVRGLDYYSHTVFEFTTDKLGAQATVLAGGRYDKLISQMGGDDIPAIGFASGIERLMELSEDSPINERSVDIFVFGPEFMNKGFELAEKIRSKDIRTKIELVKNMNKSMKKSLHNHAKHIIFIGQEEIQSNEYKIKNLDSRQEESLSLEELLNKL